MIVRKYEEDEFAVHRLPLMMMAGVVLIALGLTSAVSFGYFERQAIPDVARAAQGANVSATRLIQFYDGSDGSVRVEDASTGAVIADYAAGEGGFVRSAARSLVYNRRLKGEGQSVPFELIGWDNGTLTLRDSTTQKSIELASFGDDNKAIFAAMLNSENSQ